MCRTTVPRPAAGRRSLAGGGFTLLELIIVLLILVLLMAMVWPALRRHVLRSVVQQAATQLVRDIARARMAAIDHGQVIAFRYEPGGRRYVVTPAEWLDDDEGARSESDTQDTAPDAEQPELSAEIGFEGQLDEDVVFEDPAQEAAEELPAGSTLGEMLQEEQRESEEIQTLVEDDTADQTLSDAVFFYPTGRAENAALVLQGPDGYRITVTVRGLTGAATIGPLEHPVRSAEATDEPPATTERSSPAEEFLEPDESTQ